MKKRRTYENIKDEMRRKGVQNRSRRNISMKKEETKPPW